MADFPTALDAALHAFYTPREDYRSPVESTRGLKARVGALERAYGSKAAAARAVGISPDTWSRWSTKGRTPSADSLRKITSAHNALLRAAKVARKGAPSQFSIQATVAVAPSASFRGRDPRKSTYYNGGSSTATAAYRWFNADKLTRQQNQNVVSVWAAGGSPRAVADTLQREIERAYPGRFDFEGHNVTVDIRE